MEQPFARLYNKIEAALWHLKTITQGEGKNETNI
jgi:hypothetical protein